MNKYPKKSGFTIIEVLIVLAIAGLILVVVLIAIPQLQRNQRNNARKQDVNRLITAVEDCFNLNYTRPSSCRDTIKIRFNPDEFAIFCDFTVQYSYNTGGSGSGNNSCPNDDAVCSLTPIIDQTYSARSLKEGVGGPKRYNNVCHDMPVIFVTGLSVPNGFKCKDVNTGGGIELTSNIRDFAINYPLENGRELIGSCADNQGNRRSL